MRIAVTGTSGRVGAALVRHLSGRHEVIALPRKDLDLANPHSLTKALESLHCDVFINPAGLTSLEACEDHPALAMRINGEAPAEIATWAAARAVQLVHLSTDYVFGGEREGLRRETEEAHPINAYGRSKLAGETAVLAHPNHMVIRVSWVFGPEKASFMDQVFDSIHAGNPVSAVADKFSLPTFTQDLAAWLDCLIGQQTAGIFHACNSGEPVSWHDMASAVAEEMATCGLIRNAPSIIRQELHEITSFRAIRPRFTAMSTQRLTQILGHAPRHWREALAAHIRSRCSLA